MKFQQKEEVLWMIQDLKKKGWSITPMLGSTTKRTRNKFRSSKQGQAGEVIRTSTKRTYSSEFNREQRIARCFWKYFGRKDIRGQNSRII
jgi:hypothetical protein